jgi:hypothetical protein
MKIYLKLNSAHIAGEKFIKIHIHTQHFYPSNDKFDQVTQDEEASREAKNPTNEIQ